MKLIRTITIIAFFLSLKFNGILFATPPAGYYLVWSDEFNGSSLDTTKWGYRLPGTEHDGYDTPNALSFNGSNLVITTYTQGGIHYTCQLFTQQKIESKFGYWESSIKWSDSNGTFSAFWLLPPSQSTSAGTWIDLDEPQVSGSEIDICEHRYVDGSNVNNIANWIQVNLHWYDGSTSESSDPGSPLSPSGGGLAAGFHTYGFLWTSNAYSFLIDDSQVYTAPKSPVSQSAEYALLDTAVENNSWAGDIPSGGYGSQSASPTKMTVDYVRYYAPTNVHFWTGASSTIWNNSGNWVSNFLPVATSDLAFSYLSVDNFNMVIGPSYSVDGLIFLTSSSAFSINGLNTLTLGAGGVDMTAASQNVTFNMPINIAANQTWGVGLNRANNAPIALTDNGSLSGSATLTKSGFGTLILNGGNSFSGTLNVDTGSSTNNDGIVEISSSAAVTNVASPINIRDTGVGVSTLQLTNGIAVPPAISLAGRNGSVAAIESLSSNNTLAGGITLATGGANYMIQSDAGTMTLGGIISAGSTATGTRTLTFQGVGSFNVTGSIQNGSASAMNLIRSNTGTFTVSGTDTCTGAMTNFCGELVLNGSLGGSSLTVSGGTLSGNGTVGGAVTIQPGCGILPGSSGATGTLTFGSSLTLSAGSTNWMGINAAAGTNAQLVVAGALNCGGSLVVTNLGGTLAAGESFRLFNAGGCNGNFSSMVLPSLAPGLAWNTNSLLSGGTLSVISVSPPETLGVVNPGGNQLQLNWGYGTLQSAANVAGPYSDLTNISPPWTLPMTNAQQFYRVREN